MSPCLFITKFTRKCKLLCARGLASKTNFRMAFAQNALAKNAIDVLWAFIVSDNWINWNAGALTNNEITLFKFHCASLVSCITEPQYREC